MDPSWENVPLLYWWDRWFVAAYRFSASGQINEIILHLSCLKITFIS